jgi:hypothetical protein
VLSVSSANSVLIPISPSWITRLENALSREMDAAHKALVRSRKSSLNH